MTKTATSTTEHDELLTAAPIPTPRHPGRPAGPRPQAPEALLRAVREAFGLRPEEPLSGEGTLEGTVVTCGCHGAQFDVTTGAVLAPPALEPVKAYPLHVDKDNLVVEV